MNVSTSYLKKFATDMEVYNVCHSRSHHCFCNEIVKFVELHSLPFSKASSSSEFGTLSSLDHCYFNERNQAEFDASFCQEKRDASVQTESFNEVLTRSCMTGSISFRRLSANSFPLLGLKDYVDNYLSPHAISFQSLSKNRDWIQGLPPTRIPILMTRSASAALRSSRRNRTKGSFIRSFSAGVEWSPQSDSPAKGSCERLVGDCTDTPIHISKELLKRCSTPRRFSPSIYAKRSLLTPLTRRPQDYLLHDEYFSSAKRSSEKLLAKRSRFQNPFLSESCCSNWSPSISSRNSPTTDLMDFTWDSHDISRSSSFVGKTCKLEESWNHSFTSNFSNVSAERRELDAGAESHSDEELLWFYGRRKLGKLKKFYRYFCGDRTSRCSICRVSGSIRRLLCNTKKSKILKSNVTYQDRCRCLLFKITNAESDCKDSFLKNQSPLMDFAFLCGLFAFVLRIIELLIW